MANSVAISVHNLSVSYGENKVLDKLNFEINSGEFIGIVGKSGEGKTTLLNTLAGFVKYNGSIDLRGDIGFCFQNHSLFYWMTVAENIGFGLGNMSRNQKQEIVKDVLKRIELEKYEDKYPMELSGGQMQRVALGRAIAYNPGVLLLDEPFSSLDIYTRDQMIDWILKIISELKVTILMVTHYLDEALILADRVFVLKNKEIINELIIPFSKPRTLAVRFTEEFQNIKKDLSLIINPYKPEF
ncbi:MAG TPA: ABC transporter ATP-binding protein [Mucilaginibacter sp.]|jgi:NitT/TauT family transport system ATP-binding protein|nr:ABC transporter ATP-binding protein [Mucilaginibacter sp.]